MVQCVQGCLYTMLKQPGNVLLWTWELGLYGKSCIFHLWELDDCSLKAARETHRFIFLFITTTSLIKLLHFLKKKQGACYFLLRSHQTVLFHLIREQQVWQSIIQNTLPWPLFSWNGTVFPLCFTKLWKWRETCFFEFGYWGLMAKAFSHCESWIVVA